MHGKLPSNQRCLNASELVLSLRQQMLADGKFLFEALDDLLADEQDDNQLIQDNGRQRRRQNKATLVTANNVDRQLQNYLRENQTHKTIEMSAMLKFKSDKSKSSQMSVCIDFRFNLLRNVKKVNWKIEAPWYREVHDGLNWFGYCKNRKCQANNELFVVNRGYGIFKLDQELAEFSCPVCMQVHFDLSNMGFVNCEWAIKGKLKSGNSAKIYSDGQTYDRKLYTFDELDYKREFDHLNIFVKQVEGSVSNHSN